MTAEDLLDGFDEELGGGGAQERDWKGIVTALVVILMICFMIGVALVVFTPLTKTTHIHARRLNFSDLRLCRYPFGDFEFVDDSNESVLMQSWDGLELVTNGTRQIIIERERGEMIPSPNRENYALMIKAPNMGKNPSNVTYYTKVINRLTQKSDAIGLNRSESVLQTFLWNPKGLDFVFVEKNKIYYQKSPQEAEIILVSRNNGTTVDGLFDWVYEEEIFSKRDALWWSPDGNQLAFASYDNRLTKNITLKTYRRYMPYPIETDLHYPKTFAKTLPVYTLSIWDKNQENVKQMDVQLKDSIRYHYLYAVNWLTINNSMKLASIWANRWQNHISLTICDYENAICHLEFEYKYAEKQWATHDDFSKLIFYDNSVYFILPHEIRDNYYQNIAKIRLNANSQNSPEFVQFGNYDVASIDGINSKNQEIFFHASAPEPQCRNLYSMSLLNPKSTPTCLTCSIENCTYSQSSLSSDFTKAVVYCKGPTTRHTVLLDLTENGQNFSYPEYKPLFEHQAFKNQCEELGIPVVVYQKISLDNGYETLTKLTMSQELWAREKTRSIPLLVHVYGGPNDQNTKKTSHLSIEEYIMTNNQVAVLRIDGRGSGGRGWKYRSPVYGRLGTVEVEDQIKTIKHILQSYHFLDPQRVVVFGWSYGGFMTLSMVEQAEQGFFKCAISVAPVTNFAYYDATYTERYMGETPIEMFSDVTRNLENFRWTRLLLMHGLLDDNVHFQNSAILINELQKNLIDFDLMVYPNQAHSINARYNHLLGKISKFVDQCFSVVS